MATEALYSSHRHFPPPLTAAVPGAERAAVLATEIGRLTSRQDSVRHLAESGDWPEDDHVHRVSEYSRELATQLGLSRGEVRSIAGAARLHDVGKILMPRKILQKPGPLTRREMNLVRMHTLCGAGILALRPKTSTARQIALYHHENWDGTGYPFGLRGHDIPLAARIVAVADVYDALRSHRPYKMPVNHERARTLIMTGDSRTRPGQFCPEVLRAFLVAHDRFADIYDHPLRRKWRTIISPP